MAGPFRVACVGASAFVASLAHGVCEAMAAPLGGPGRLGRGVPRPRRRPEFSVHLALVGADSDRSARLAEYVRLVAAERGAAVQAEAMTREAALDGATLVFAAPEVAEGEARLRRICAAVGWAPPADGPGAVALAVATGPAHLRLAREVASRSPTALLVGLSGPTDALAGAARRRFGIAGLRSVGLSADAEDLRDVLAHLFEVDGEDVLLVHGGVARVGWVVRFAVNGHDGYGEMGDRLRQLPRDGRMRPGDAPLGDLYALTGMLRSGARQTWPFAWRPAGEAPSGWSAGSVGAASPPAFSGLADASDEQWLAALRAGHPLAVRTEGHPEDSPLPSPGTGRSMGRLVVSMATGETVLVSLQVPYAGDVLGWSPEVTVEVPALVAGSQIEPMAVGPLPAGVDGLPRLLGQQRALASDYLAHPDPAVLQRAFATTPEWGRVDQMRALASALQGEFGAELEDAVRP